MTKIRRMPRREFSGWRGFVKVPRPAGHQAGSRTIWYHVHAVESVRTDFCFFAERPVAGWFGVAPMSRRLVRAFPKVVWFISAGTVMVVLVGPLVCDDRRTEDARIARTTANLAVAEEGLRVFHRYHGRLPTEEEGLQALVMPTCAEGVRCVESEGLLEDAWGRPFAYTRHSEHRATIRGVSPAKAGGQGSQASDLIVEVDLEHALESRQAR